MCTIARVRGPSGYAGPWRSWSRTTLAVWGSGVRIPSAPPRMIETDALVRSNPGNQGVRRPGNQKPSRARCVPDQALILALASPMRASSAAAIAWFRSAGVLVDHGRSGARMSDRAIGSFDGGAALRRPGTSGMPEGVQVHVHISRNPGIGPGLLPDPVEVAARRYAAL